MMPWSKSTPYDWTRWFAWFPVRAIDGHLKWLSVVEVRAHGEIAPVGQPGFQIAHE
jgi:hypothetical protein